jgi:thiol:disulfide interchange protein DsbC
LPINLSPLGFVNQQIVVGGIRKMNPIIAAAPSGATLKRRFVALVVKILAPILLSGAVLADDAMDILAASLSSFVGQPVSIDSVNPSPAPGIAEVQITNGPLIYATEDGAYFFLNGDLHQTGAFGAINLTEERRAAVRKEQLAAISPKDMVVFKPEGETLDYISVFTDVTCFYCQKLHREVDQLNSMGIEVRYLAFPRGGIPSDSATKLATAWCSMDRQTTLTELKAGVEMPLNECADNPIAMQYQIGQQMGVSGTPAIITSAGQMIPGYRPAADLAAVLGLD